MKVMVEVSEHLAKEIFDYYDADKKERKDKGLIKVFLIAAANERLSRVDKLDR